MHSDDQPPAPVQPGESYDAPSMDFTSPYAPLMAHDVTGIRPTGLTVIGVLCTLGGIIGVMTGLLGLAQLFLAETFANAFMVGEGAMAEAQREMQQQTQAVTNSVFIPSLISLLATFAISVTFFIGGIGILRDRASARSLLRKAFLAAIVLEICRGVLQSVVQMKMMPIMETYMGEIASGANGQGGSAVISQFATIGIIIGIVFWLIWAAIKIALLVWGRFYLNRSTVIEYLNSKQRIA